MQFLIYFLDTNPSPQLLELDSAQRFCQNVRELMIRADEVHRDLVLLHSVPDEMEPQVNVFATIVVNKILG